jgi:peroxiredoxin
MKLKGAVLLTVFAILAVSAFVLNYAMTEAGGTTAEPRGGLEIGATVENFSLTDTEGAAKSLNDLKGKNGTVVVWLSAQCPVVKAYKDRINEIAADYQAKGINFVGINSNATEDLTWVKSNKTEFGYNFPLLIDKGNVLADKWGASVTPEVFYLDAKNVLLYHGAIDNDRSGRNITDQYLKTAFDSALTGKAIAKTRANAFGCTIKRVGE